MNSSLDPVWDMKYGDGHMQRYPWDEVVSFVFRYAPRDKDRRDIHVAEVGFGTGSNLWFAAREGFRVSGVEGSKAAVKMAVDRFRQEKLDGDLRVGLFPEMPWSNNQVDLLIDRGAITCVGFELAARTLEESHRVLVPGGKMYFTPYSSMDSSADCGSLGEDGCIRDITDGPMQGVGSICFYDRQQVSDVIGEGWNILQMSHSVSDDECKDHGRHALWRIVLEKRS